MSIKKNICDYARFICNMLMDEENPKITQDLMSNDKVVPRERFKEAFEEIRKFPRRDIQMKAYYVEFYNFIMSYDIDDDFVCQCLWMYNIVVRNKLFTRKKLEKHLKTIEIKMSPTVFVISMGMLMQGG